MCFAARSPPRLSTLVILTALSVVSMNLFLPSLSAMAEDFEADYAVVTLAIAGYLAATAGIMLLAGPLSDRFGRRPVLLIALAIYVLASLGCSVTGDIWIFLTFRVLQGAIIAGWTLSLAIIRDTAPPQQAASRIGYVAMAMAVAPMLGPIVGGLLDGHFGWRANFVLLTLLGLAAFALTWVDLGETNRRKSETLAKQMRSYPELLAAPRFWGLALCMVFTSGSFHVFLAGAPLVAVTTLGLTPAALGFYLGTITAGYILGSFLSGRHAERFALTTMMLTGRIVSFTGLAIGLILVSAGVVNVGSVFGATVFVGFGNGLTSPSCHAGVLSVRPDLAGSSAGLSGAVTLGCGALLTMLVGALVRGEAAAIILLGILLLLSFLGMAATLFVRQIDKREALPATSS